jgi:N-formylglutamate deformylase
MASSYMDIFQLESCEGPLIAAAIHDGHSVREDVAVRLALTSAERLREEDPYTAFWATVAPTRIVGLRSRFQVDLNRPREFAVYRKPEDAWGLEVWKHGGLWAEEVERSLAEYDAFYAAVHELLSRAQKDHGRFVVLDLHTYNHRRNGPDAEPADPIDNPEVNIGTGSMNRRRWGHVVDRFIDDLRATGVQGRALDVRENVKFRGGHLSRWVHENFPDSGCSIAVEFKKFFMDEWTGEPDLACVEAIRNALSKCVPGILLELSVP